MVRPWSAFETSPRGTSFVLSRHSARNRSNLITIPPPPWRGNWGIYILIPDSPAYTIGLQFPDGHTLTGEQVWDIDLGYWNRAVARVPPDEFVRPGVVHLGRSAIIPPAFPHVVTQDEFDEQNVFAWAQEDPVPDRIWPQSRPFPPNIVLAGRPGEPTYRFGNHQAPFDAYYNFIGQPQTLEGFSVTHYGRRFHADLDQYSPPPPGPGIHAILASGSTLFYWGKWFNEGTDDEVRDETMLPHAEQIGEGPEFRTRGHIRTRIGDNVYFWDQANLRAFGPEDPPDFRFDRGSIFFEENNNDEGFLAPAPPYDEPPNDLNRSPGFRHRWLKDLAWQLAPGSIG